MHNEIGAVVLGSLSAVFAGYGVCELTLAYRVTALSAWVRRAIAGSASMFVAAVFAVMTVQCLAWRWPSVPPGTGVTGAGLRTGPAAVVRQDRIVGRGDQAGIGAPGSSGRTFGLGAAAGLGALAWRNGTTSVR